jgi:hypothetical protein
MSSRIVSLSSTIPTACNSPTGAEAVQQVQPALTSLYCCMSQATALSEGPSSEPAAPAPAPAGAAGSKKQGIIDYIALGDGKALV